jgi:hypothetical protein
MRPRKRRIKISNKPWGILEVLNHAEYVHWGNHLGLVFI